MSPAGTRRLGPHPVPGDRLGPYILGTHLATGGIASVHRGTDPDGRTVALKILDPNRVLHEDLKRFQREFASLASLDHPGIVRVFQSGETGGYPWFALEFVEGHDLSDLISSWRREPDPDRFQVAERIFREICTGLQYVHERGIVHRDIKPANILLTRELEAKISDFGVAKDEEAQSHLTMAGRLVGTIAFMAPELISGEVVDHRADLYGLGAVLYHMLTLRRPIEATSLAGYLARHLTEVPTPPGEIDPGVPPRLERVCQRLLAKDPAQRFPTAKAVLDALDDARPGRRLPMHGRDDQLEAWRRCLDGLEAGVGGALAIVGPRGSGKTRVIHSLAGLARDRGIQVAWLTLEDDGLRWAGLPADRDLSTPTVLLAEDLDEQAPHVLRQLLTLHRDQLAEGRPLLMAWTAVELTGAVGDLWAAGAERMDLAPLDRASITAILRDRGVPGPTAAALGFRLQGEHTGQPQAVLLQLEALIEDEWLIREGDRLQSRRPVSAFRKDDLPVPASIRRRIEGRIEDLATEERELVELLALLARPVARSTLGQASAVPARTPGLVDRLVGEGLVTTEVELDRELLRLANPTTSVVARSLMGDSLRQGRHLAIASALGRQRRRRLASVEVADHLVAGGKPQEAVSMYLSAARRAARSFKHRDVLKIAEKLSAALESSDLPEDEAHAIRTDHLDLHGGALIGLGRWSEAVPSLEAAVEAHGHGGDPVAGARSQAALGRARYRMGSFDDARRLLTAALQAFPPGAPERSPAIRTLSDIHLQFGELPDAAALLQEALLSAQAADSPSDEARARRGLGHLRSIQGRYAEAAEELDLADELLEAGGDARVRAGILARSIDLDFTAGRYGSALYRAELLVDLIRSQQISHRLPDGLAVLAEVKLALGQREEALQHAQRALLFVRAQTHRTWDGLFRAVRVMIDCGEEGEDHLRLLAQANLSHLAIYAAGALRTALQARMLAESDPRRAAELAHAALTADPALWPIARARLVLDTGEALRRSGHAEETVARVDAALEEVGTERTRGTRLQLHLLRLACGDGSRLAEARQTAEGVLSELPQRVRTSFLARPDIAALQIPEP